MATVNPKGLDYFLASAVQLRECFNEWEDIDVEKCVLGQLNLRCGKCVLGQLNLVQTKPLQLELPQTTLKMARTSTRHLIKLPTMFVEVF